MGAVPAASTNDVAVERADDYDWGPLGRPDNLCGQAKQFLQLILANDDQLPQDVILAIQFNRVHDLLAYEALVYRVVEDLKDNDDF